MRVKTFKTLKFLIKIKFLKESHPDKKNIHNHLRLLKIETEMEKTEKLLFLKKWKRIKTNDL